jgi:hypothetical protein
VRLPYGPALDAVKDDMVWCGNVVATAWKDYLRWIMIEMGVGNAMILREIMDTMEVVREGVVLPAGRAASIAADKTAQWVADARRSQAANR